MASIEINGTPVPIKGDNIDFIGFTAGKIFVQGKTIPLPDTKKTDTDDLLQAAGYSPADCVKLREAGVIS